MRTNNNSIAAPNLRTSNRQSPLSLQSATLQFTSQIPTTTALSYVPCVLVVWVSLSWR